VAAHAAIGGGRPVSFDEAVDVMAYAAYSKANLSETLRFPAKLHEALNVLRSHRSHAPQDCDPAVSPV
jgi:hypothetical protein